MKKILLVEDQKFLVEPLSNALTNAGFEVLIAYDGAQGLESAKTNHPDLILLDVVMPVMDGITMLKKLREDSWGAKAQVIILTNLTSSETLENAKEQNVSDFLIKSNWKLEDVVNLANTFLSET